MATRNDTDQAADEAARTARTVTDEAARVGEQIKRDEQAHKNADAARAGADKLANFRQRATEDALRTEEALKSVRSAADAASLGLQSVFDQFAPRWASPGRRANGWPGSQCRTWKQSQSAGPC